MEQGFLFEWRRSGRLTIQERWERFREEHPDVYRLFTKLAFELWDAGVRHWGAKNLAERIRFEFVVSSANRHIDPQVRVDKYKIPNVIVSRMVRKLIEEYPQFAEMFTLAKLKSP